MGEIAYMILDGTLDSKTFECLGVAMGYPRTEYDAQFKARSDRTRERRERRKCSRVQAALATGGAYG